MKFPNAIPWAVEMHSCCACFFFSFFFGLWTLGKFIAFCTINTQNSERLLLRRFFLWNSKLHLRFFSLCCFEQERKTCGKRKHLGRSKIYAKRKCWWNEEVNGEAESLMTPFILFEPVEWVENIIGNCVIWSCSDNTKKTKSVSSKPARWKGNANHVVASLRCAIAHFQMILAQLHTCCLMDWTKKKAASL